MLYYFASKEELYAAVLDSVLEAWLDSMATMARSNDPGDGGQQLCARQAALLAGAAQRLGGVHPARSWPARRAMPRNWPPRVIPHLREEVRAFRRWARQGLIAKLDFTHLMFLIWSSTQAYADLAPQFALLIGKKRLEDRDFEAAHALITQLIMQSLKRAEGSK